MANPFEDEAAIYCVVVNEEGQHSLWPTFLPIPNGWTAVGAKGDRRGCLAWIDANWTDMRPTSLIAQMKNSEQQPNPSIIGP